MTPLFSAGRRLSALVLMLAGLAACSQQGAFAFASRSAELNRALPPGLTEIKMGEDPVIIAAPEGFCFDQRTLDRSKKGGFALLARCENLRPLTRHRLSNDGYAEDPAVISATISGPLSDAKTPNIKALIAATDPVRVVSKRPDTLMPLIQMEAKAPGIPGSSTTQWRGVMSIGNRLIALSLHAPEGSDLLGPSGARLLREVAEKSNQRSQKAIAVPDRISVLRPKARPAPAS